jgi:catalase
MTGAGGGGYVHFPEPVDGPRIRKRSESFDDHYSQATLFYNSLSDWERQHLVDACSFELSHCDFEHVKVRALECFNQIDHGLAVEVAGNLGLPAPAAVGENHGRSSPALSLANSPHDSVATRKVAVLVAEGADLSALGPVRDPLTGEGAKFELVGVHAGELAVAGGSVQIRHALYSANSALFDAVLVPDGEAAVQTLLQLGNARRWIAEAYRHGKAVAAFGAGVGLLDAVIGSHAQLSSGPLSAEHGVVTTTGAPGADFAAALRAALAAHREFHRPGIQAAL